MGGISGAVLNGKDGAVSGASAAIIAETLADLVTPQVRDIAEKTAAHSTDEASFDQAMDDYLLQQKNVILLTTASIMAGLGQDVNIAITAADNALSNNFIPTILKTVSKVFVKETAKKASKEGVKKGVKEVGKEVFKFTGKTTQHMENPKRAIPVQILKDIIKAPVSVAKDPQGTNAIMHYARITKNGKNYNAEVLYDKISNTIMHFKYERGPLGPLEMIRK